MSFLVRTRVGSFNVDQAFSLEEIALHPESALLPLDHALQYMPKITVSPEIAKAFKHGQHIPTTMSEEYDQNLLRIYDHENVLIGIGQKKEKVAVIIPIKVLISGQS